MTQFMESSLIISIGGLIIVSVLSWMIYHMGRGWKYSSDESMYESALWIEGVKKVAEKKGINLEKKLLEREVIRKKGFSKSLKEHIVKDFFENLEEKEKKKN